MMWLLNLPYSDLPGRSLNQRQPTVRISRADIHARGFWGQWKSDKPTSPSLCQHRELQKKEYYGECVTEVEQASFTPLIIVTTGGMGREAVISC